MRFDHLESLAKTFAKYRIASAVLKMSKRDMGILKKGIPKDAEIHSSEDILGVFGITLYGIKIVIYETT